MATTITVKLSVTNFDLLREAVDAQHSYHLASADDESLSAERRHGHRAKALQLAGLKREITVS